MCQKIFVDTIQTILNALLLQILKGSREICSICSFLDVLSVNM